MRLHYEVEHYPQEDGEGGYEPSPRILSVCMKDTNEKKQGLYESYYENGQLQIRANYKDDQLDGPFECHDKDGKLIEKGSYVNGKFVPQETNANLLRQNSNDGM